MGCDVLSVEWDGWVSPEGKMVSIMRLFLKWLMGDVSIVCFLRSRGRGSGELDHVLGSAKCDYPIERGTFPWCVLVSSVAFDWAVFLYFGVGELCAPRVRVSYRCNSDEL